MAPMPARDDDFPEDDQDAPAAPAAGDDAGDEGAAADDKPMPLCTVMANPDGTYSVVGGDGDAGAYSMEGPEGEEPSAPDQGQSFDGPGPVLKAVWELIKQHQVSNGGSDQANFEQGFDTGSTAMPKPKAPPAPAA